MLSLRRKESSKGSSISAAEDEGNFQLDRKWRRPLSLSIQYYFVGVVRKMGKRRCLPACFFRGERRAGEKGMKSVKQTLKVGRRRRGGKKKKQETFNVVRTQACGEGREGGLKQQVTNAA